MTDGQLVRNLVTAELSIIFIDDFTGDQDQNSPVKHPCTTREGFAEQELPIRVSHAIPTLSNVAVPTSQAALKVPGTIGARMACTGQVLKIKLDTSLSVGAVRQQIAVALDTGDDMVVLMGPDGEDLSDEVTLAMLGLAEVCVMRKRRNIALGPADTATPGNKAMAISRLSKELSKFDAIAPCGFTAEEANPSDKDSLFCWRVHFPWPESMPHEEEECEIIMRFPFDYPFNSPEVFFVEDVQHWAVASNGKALLDVLGKEWSPSWWSWIIACGVHSVLHDSAEP